MTARRQGHAALGCLAALLILITAAVAERAAHPAAGTWDVIEVAVDRRDQPHWLYVPDDPRLHGRELVVGAQALTFNDGSAPCQQPTWADRKARLGQLVGASFPRSGGRGRPAAPTLADFGLPESLNKGVSVHTVRCQPRGDGRNAQPWNEAWFVVSPPDRMFMRIGTSALVTLARRPANAAPKPSFVCTVAMTAIETLLCGSVPLAALDRSIAAAFERKLARGDAVQLRAQQAEWLKRRDACGRDEACLAEAMRRRIDELSQN